MRTFFFSATKENCSTDCRWQICPQRYLAALQDIAGLQDIEPLGEGYSCFLRISEKSPKNGDLVILYAKDQYDLEALVRVRELFDGLKRILVVADPACGDDRKYHLLEPRYITQAGRNLAEMEAVVHRMAGSVQ
ncbi:MAG: hypothetical protein V2B20_14760 [Pseudomonadota bacterium]